MLDDNKICEILEYLNQTTQRLRIKGCDYTYSIEIKFGYYADSKRVFKQYVIVKWNGTKLFSKARINYPIVDSLQIYADDEIANMEHLNKECVADICKRNGIRKRREKQKERRIDTLIDK